MKNISMTSKQIKITEEPLLAPEVFKHPQGHQSPHFIRSEYRGSETESDFESRSMPKWRANDSDSEPQYRPVVFAPSTRSQDDHQQKWTPMSKPALVRKPDNHNWQTQSTTYYQSVAGQPVHNAIETTNSMQMHEKSESNQRVVNLQSTTKIINFNNQLYGDPVPFPYSVSGSEQDHYHKNRLPLPPTPTKFVKGEFRESDYDSEMEAAKIRPLWTPTPNDSDDRRFRSVNAPRNTRSSSCPRSQEQISAVSPLVFDTQPPYQPASTFSTQTLDRSTTKHHHTTTAMKHVQTRANEMSGQFKMKAQNFISGFEKKDHLSQTPASPAKPNEPQVYRDGSRVSQYGE